MTKVAVCLGYPVVDNARRNAGAATLRFCLDQRTKISKRNRHRRSRLVAVLDGPVRSVGREQALDQRGRWLDGMASFRELIASIGPHVVFGKEAEAALLGDGYLLGGGALIVKLGRGRPHRREAVPCPAHRSGRLNRRGRCVAAGYLVGGVELGLAAAARAVAKMGAMP